MVLLSMWFALRAFISPSIEVVKPIIGPALQAVYATGTVEAEVMLPVAARNSARIITLHADEGSQVKKGSLLAQLEDEDFRRTIEELAAKERFAKNEIDRATSLLTGHVSSKQEYERAKSEWEAAKAAVRRAEAQNEFMKLSAPDNCVVIRRDGEIGELIPANQAVFWLNCGSLLRISADVDEEDIPLVKVGQKVLIRADAFPNQVFQGEVQSITPKGDAIARSFRVRIKFTEENPLQIGMTAETNIISSVTKEALLLPNSAVDKDALWLVVDSTIIKKQVSIGARGLERTEIKNGITKDDFVVLSPSKNLRVGAKTRTSLVDWN